MEAGKMGANRMKWSTQELLAGIARPRAVGTALNQEITEEIGAYLSDCGYAVRKLPFPCKVWKKGESFLEIGGKKLTVQVSPYSEGFTGSVRAVTAGSLQELEAADCTDRVLFLTEELSKEQLQPKDYPFYYPDEHKQIIDCLEKKKPCAIIAVTGQSCASGLDPFPVIEDGNFHIPVGSIKKECFAEIRALLEGGEVRIEICSENQDSTAMQLIASKKAAALQGTITICAHMDSKYDTDGALDNASGVVTMLLAAKQIAEKWDGRYDIDIVPFNTEEYYAPTGELLYLEELQKEGRELSLLVNIDTVAHKGSKVAVASFNLTEAEQEKVNEEMTGRESITAGAPWYAGDHAPFVFGGTKCLLLSASDLLEDSIGCTHCPKDKLELVDESLIADAAAYISRIVDIY